MHQNKFEHLTMCQNKLEHLIEFNNAARIKQVTLKFFLYSYIHILVIIIHDEIQNLMNKSGGRTVVGQRRRALSHLYCIFVFLFSRILVFANSCFCKFLFLRIFLFSCFRGFLKKWKSMRNSKLCFTKNPNIFDEQICWEDSSGAEEEVAPWW